MLTTEQKAWQLYENGVSYAELCMICQSINISIDGTKCLERKEDRCLLQ